MHVLNATYREEIIAAFATVLQRKADALLVSPEPFFNAQREQIVALAAHHAVPVIYGFREFVPVGGLASYGTSRAYVWYKAGIYTGKILKGVKPSDLPVEQTTKVELIINLKTAKVLGLTVPTAMLVRADEVIE